MRMIVTGGLNGIEVTPYFFFFWEGPVPDGHYQYHRRGDGTRVRSKQVVDGYILCGKCQMFGDVSCIVPSKSWVGRDNREGESGGSR